MKSNFLKYFHCIIIVLVLSCNSNKSKEDKIKIDLSNYKNTINLSEFVDSLSYIQLETNDSCLISEIEYLSVADKKIFIKDVKSGGILIFNTNGRFISKLNKFGSGPGEFNRIHSFDINNKNKNILIHDDLSKRLISYSYDGKFLTQIKIKEYIRDFALVGNDKFVFLRPDGYINTNDRNGIWYANIMGDFEKTIIKGSTKNSLFIRGAELCCKMQDSVYYYDMYTDKVFCIKNDIVKCIYSFNLMQKTPHEILSNPNGKLNNYFMKIGFYVTKNNVLIFYISDNDYRVVVLNRNNKSMLIGKDFMNNIDDYGIENIVGVFDENTLVASIASKNRYSNPSLQILHLKK